ncbi:MAG: hypothetical protein A4E65_03615 [Syntrophorhabdus sp. PtaU1.Bin153]|nr:MAG: hypothetical protein A4E65_03615 [Syntrophorhabdus sp. PtaU1.Bin153]
MEKSDFLNGLEQAGVTGDDLQEQLPVSFMEAYGGDLLAFDNALERIIMTGSSDDLGRFLRVCILLTQTAAQRHEKAIKAAKGKAAMDFWSDKWGKA